MTWRLDHQPPEIPGTDPGAPTPVPPGPEIPPPVSDPNPGNPVPVREPPAMPTPMA